MHPDNAYLELGQIYRPRSLWTHACMHSLVFATISHTSAYQPWRLTTVRFGRILLPHPVTAPAFSPVPTRRMVRAVRAACRLRAAICPKTVCDGT